MKKNRFDLQRTITYLSTKIELQEREQGRANTTTSHMLLYDNIYSPKRSPIDNTFYIVNTDLVI